MGVVEYRVMKKLLLTLAALPMAAYAGAATAQNMANSGGAVGLQNRIANLEARYNAGVSAGVFTTGERSTLDRQLTELRSLERRYSSNGLTPAERRTLQQRIRTVRDQLRMAGGTGWAGGYGWSDNELDTYAGGSGGAYDAYGRPSQQTGVTYDRYGRAVSTNGVVYDQYGRPVATNGVVYDQYGRPVAGGYGQGGPYEPVSQGSGVGNVLGGVLGSVVGGNSGVGGVLGNVIGGGSGVGGVLGNVMGGGGAVGGVLGSVLGGGGAMGGILGSVLSRGGLRTGEVITGALGSVLGSAAGLNPRYRDSSNVYYRSDGQRVYEIDARTNTVIRVLPVQP